MGFNNESQLQIRGAEIAELYVGRVGTRLVRD